MYSSDRMKPLIRMFKDYDKNIVFKACQMHFLNIYLSRKEIPLIFFRHFVELSSNVQCVKVLLWNVGKCVYFVPANVVF